MSDTVLMAGIALIVGCALGWLAAWLVWRRRAAGLNQHTRTLRAALKGQEARLLDARVCLQACEAKAQHLRDQVRQNQDTIRSLTAHVEEQRHVMHRLDLAIKERDGCIRAMRAQIGETGPWTGGFPSFQGSKPGTADFECLGVMMRVCQDRGRGTQACLRENERRLMDLNVRLVELIWGLEAGSKGLYGGEGRGDGAIHELEAWIECRTGAGNLVQRW